MCDHEILYHHLHSTFTLNFNFIYNKPKYVLIVLTLTKQKATYGK